MRLAKGLILVAIGAGALFAIGRYGYHRFYAAERETLERSLARSRGNTGYFEDRLKDAPKVRADLKTFGASTLAGTEEEARHHLRTLLHKIAAAEGLQGIVVSDGRAEGMRNPAATARVKETGLSKRLSQGTDFQVITGTVKGSGSLEQVLRTMGVVRSQPWAHRIDGFTLKPKDDAREVFELNLEVATLLVRDLVPAEQPEPTLVALAPDSSLAWRGLVAKNAFKEPPPPAKPAVVAAAPPSEKPRPKPEPPPPPPYGDWELVGVWMSGERVEAWLKNRSSNERKALVPGMGVLGAVLVSAEGERAVFEIEGQRCEVRLQQTLAQRRLVN